MAFFYGKSLNFLKIAWATQPVLFVSTLMGALGPLIVFASPLSKKAIQSVKDIPTRYPYPVSQDRSQMNSADS